MLAHRRRRARRAVRSPPSNSRARLRLRPPGLRSRAVTGDMLACWLPHAAARVRLSALRGPCTRAHLRLLALHALALVCYFFI